MDPSRLKFQTLQHFLFLLRKLLDCSLPPSDTIVKSSSDLNSQKFSSHGGFLSQPMPEKIPENADQPLSAVGLDLQEEFSYSLCQAAWPSLWKCLADGKSFICSSVGQVLGHTQNGLVVFTCTNNLLILVLLSLELSLRFTLM